MLRKSHVGIRHQKPLLRTKITKKGKDTYPSPSSVFKTAVKSVHLYLVLVPSSFLPHPAKVSIKAKRVVPDNKTILFPILSSPPFPTHLWKTVLLDHFLLHNSGSLARGFMENKSHRGA